MQKLSSDREPTPFIRSRWRGKLREKSEVMGNRENGSIEKAKNRREGSAS